MFCEFYCMGKILDLYIYGEIGWNITLSSIVPWVNENKDAESILLHIDSPGGTVSDGWAIHDFLKSQSIPVNVVIEGLCASISTVIALACKDKGGKISMFENAEFMIHNPWTMAVGDAEEFSETIEELQKIEQKLVSFYSKKTGKDESEISEMMSQETFLSAYEAFEYGFITEVIKTMSSKAINKNSSHKIYALYKAKVQKITAKKMNASPLANFISKMENLIRIGKKEIKNGVCNADEGALYYVGDTLEEGDKVYSDEAMTEPAEDMDYTDDDRVITVKNGMVSEINKDEDGDDENEEPEPSDKTKADDDTEDKVKNEVEEVEDKTKNEEEIEDKTKKEVPSKDPDADPEKKDDDMEEYSKNLKAFTKSSKKYKNMYDALKKEHESVLAKLPEFEKTIEEAQNKIQDLQAQLLKREHTIKEEIKSSFIPGTTQRVEKTKKTIEPENIFADHLADNPTAQAVLDRLKAKKEIIK